ncbi:MAG: tRNA (guanosine(46)-N7)-methyltransferase TrmB [Pseudomonadota bacterium]
MSEPRHRPIRTFGRTGGRPLSPRQQALIDLRLPDLAVPDSDPHALDPASLFDQAREVWLEIGFGGGEHLAGQSARHPDIGFIGCEPFIEGMAKAISAIEEDGLANVRLHMEDAREVIDRLADASIARVFILFPDPWPKTRHHKRRLIQPDFLSALWRALAPAGRVRFATDVRSYADEALWRFLAHGGFDWAAERADDWRRPPADHIMTRYEAKRLGDCAPVWFEFVRRASAADSA